MTSDEKREGEELTKFGMTRSDARSVAVALGVLVGGFLAWLVMALWAPGASERWVYLGVALGGGGGLALALRLPRADGAQARPRT